ncbi:hypothetical protein OsI_35225 [Oryza sativa Indica Group]|uniref:Uncharacterized protein n=5 Tax=Oryza TaxID=4527 RepID=A0A979HJT4_ORYSJ|nr:hypothetical protein LOC_Os11g06450 [Oryza sativa Japonica Group]ABA91677.1 hypothetical protein LOC_Os11g06450 [Oryza sativa Japonica Group]EAY80059.1 hypothetical protein OsI_35225 [Oryza sativa Indica Group]EAZ17541.1 hypothetical protein OsJ_33074 [Oryza sativa Japonica Group]
MGPNGTQTQQQVRGDMHAPAGSHLFHFSNSWKKRQETNTSSSSQCNSTPQKGLPNDTAHIITPATHLHKVSVTATADDESLFIRMIYDSHEEQKLQRIQDSDWMMMMETQYYIFRGLSFGVRDNYKSRTMKKIAQKTEILGSSTSTKVEILYRSTSNQAELQSRHAPIQ